jgi:hypothetical protein
LRCQSSTSSPGMTSSMHAQSCYSQLSPVSARASSLFDKKSGFNDEGSFAQQAPSSPLVLPAKRREVRLFACFLFSESAGGGMCVRERDAHTHTHTQKERGEFMLLTSQD